MVKRFVTISHNVQILPMGINRKFKTINNIQMQIENSNVQVTSESMPIGNILLSDVNSFDNRKIRLQSYLLKKVLEYKESGGEMFMDLPDAWYEPFTICCPNGHVIHRYLKSEKKGNVCLACYEPTYLCPPDTIEEELIKVVIL